jgi:aspartate kinase
VVLKFGGTSVADIPQIKKIALKVKKEVELGHKVIVVVSAMSGVTNNLVDLVKQVSKNFPYSEYDTILSTGEQITSALLSVALEELSLKARSWMGWQVPIISDNAHGKAVIKEIKTVNITNSINK